MKAFIKPFALVAASTLLLAGCGGDSSSSRAPAFTPTAESFSDFVANQFDVDPATSEPVEINNRDFTFLDENNPDAFDEQLN